MIKRGDLGAGNNAIECGVLQLSGKLDQGNEGQRERWQERVALSLKCLFKGQKPNLNLMPTRRKMNASTVKPSKLKEKERIMRCGTLNCSHFTQWPSGG